LPDPLRLVVASHNPKKTAELLEILAPLQIDVLPLSAFPDIGPIAETGATFEANARIKAEAVCAATSLPALADDSGLAVDALDGAPGVYSARYAGEAATDAENNALLLERLETIHDTRRTARFVCAVAFARPGRSTRCFTGETRGTILRAPRGRSGFGYDPLFLSDDLGVTFAEAAGIRKHTVSHRGRALQAFLAFCRQEFGPATPP